MMVYYEFKQLTTMKIRWFAIDDQRIQVIDNYFNMENPNDNTFPIKNPNASFAFVAFIKCRSSKFPFINNNIYYLFRLYKYQLYQ